MSPPHLGSRRVLLRLGRGRSKARRPSLRLWGRRVRPSCPNLAADRAAPWVRVLPEAHDLVVIRAVVKIPVARYRELRKAASWTAGPGMGPAVQPGVGPRPRSASGGYGALRNPLRRAVTPRARQLAPDIRQEDQDQDRDDGLTAMRTPVVLMTIALGEGEPGLSQTPGACFRPRRRPTPPSRRPPSRGLPPWPAECALRS